MFLKGQSFKLENEKFIEPELMYVFKADGFCQISNCRIKKIYFREELKLRKP